MNNKENEVVENTLQENKRKNNIFKNPKMKHKTFAVLITVLSILLVVGINILTDFLNEKFHWEFDFTKNQVFNLTKESIDYIQKLENDITITVLNSETNFRAGGEYFIQADNVIKRYSQYSSKISVNYVNLEENPTYVNSYPNETLEASNIIVQSGSKYQVLTPYDLFNIQQSYYDSFIESSQSEQALTSAIVKVSSSAKAKVCMIKGMGEKSDSSVIEGLLSKNNYEVVTADVLTDDIPTDAQIAVVFAPSSDLDDECISKLNKYLDNHEANRSVLLVPDYNVPAIEKINTFLSSWGVQLKDGVVFELNNENRFTRSPYFAKNEFVDETYTNGLKNPSIPIAVPYSKPIVVTDESIASVLAKFSELSGITPDNAPKEWIPKQSDIIGNIPCITMSEKESDGIKSRVWVVGSSMAFDEQLLSRSFLNNSAYFLNVFRILSDREDSFVIESKDTDAHELGISTALALTLGAVTSVGFSLVVVCGGIFVWIKRKKL